MSAFPSPGAGRNGKGNDLGTRFDEASVDASEHREAVREIRPWREVGWIFKDGDALAIERQGDRIRARSARVSHLREE